MSFYVAQTEHVLLRGRDQCGDEQQYTNSTMQVKLKWR